MKQILIYEPENEVYKLSMRQVTFGKGVRSDEQEALLKIGLYLEKSGNSTEVIVMMGGEEVGCMEKSLKIDQLPVVHINSEQLLLMHPTTTVYNLIQELTVQTLYKFSKLFIERPESDMLNIKLECFDYSSQLFAKNFEIPVSLEVVAQRTGLKVPAGF